MKKYAWLMCLLLVLFGGAVFGWHEYFFDNTDCTNNQMILDLQHKLSQYKRKYSINKHLDSVLKSDDVLKVSFDNRRFYSTDNSNNTRAVELLRFLNRELKLNAKPFSFYILLGDTSKLPSWSFSVLNTPILMVDMDKQTYAQGQYFLVPDFYLIRKGYKKLAKKLQKQSEVVPFEDKKDIVFWRGAQTGGMYSYGNKEQRPRYNLVVFSLNNPSYADARFISHKIQVEDSESGRKYIGQMDLLFGSNPEKYAVHAKDHVKYKYLISLDGNVSTWERPLKIMNGRSVLLYNTKFVQFFTTYMKEGEHYIAVKEDLSDLKQKVDWLRENPQEAERVANNGRDFAETMTSKLFACYYKDVLEHIQNNFVSEQV